MTALKTAAHLALILLLCTAFALPALAQETAALDPNHDAKKAIADKFAAQIESGAINIEEGMNGALAEAAQQGISASEFAAMLTESLFLAAIKSGMTPEASVNAISAAIYKTAAASPDGAAEQAAIIANGIAGMRAASQQHYAEMCQKGGDCDIEPLLAALNALISNRILDAHNKSLGANKLASVIFNEIALTNVINTALTDPVALTYTAPPGQGGAPPGQQGPRVPGTTNDFSPGPRTGTPAPDFESPASPAGA